MTLPAPATTDAMEETTSRDEVDDALLISEQVEL
jgi:hypothetical protein